MIQRASVDAAGVPVGEPEHDRATWLELQGHASYPAEQTTIEPDRLDTPMGRLDCLRYTIVDGSRSTMLWFARLAPGMPVKSAVVEDGRVTTTMTMVADTRLAGLLEASAADAVGVEIPEG